MDFNTGRGRGTRRGPVAHRAQQGDEEAFDTLARSVGDRCMAIACRILRDVDLGEDAVQVARITAWRELRSLRDPDRVVAAPSDPDPRTRDSVASAFAAVHPD